VGVGGKQGGLRAARRGAPKARPAVPAAAAAGGDGAGKEGSPACDGVGCCGLKGYRGALVGVCTMHSIFIAGRFSKTIGTGN
jgi:hypothetical protein